MSLATQIRDGSHRIRESPNKTINTVILIATIVSALIIGIYTIINVFFISNLDYKYTTSNPLVISNTNFLDSFDKNISIKLDSNTPECLVVGSSNDMITYAGDNSFESLTGTTPTLGLTTSLKPFVSSSSSLKPLSNKFCSSDMWREVVTNNQSLEVNLNTEQYKGTSFGIYNPAQTQYSIHIQVSYQYDWTLPFVVIVVLISILLICWIIIFVRNHHRTRTGIPFWERITYKVKKYNKSDLGDLNHDVEQHFSRGKRRKI